MSRFSHLALGCVLVTSAGLAAGTKVKPPAKPAAKPAPKPAPKPATAPTTLRPVKGTTQMSGDDAKIGTTFTLGKQGAINFTLDSAEFRVERVNFSGDTVAPKADEKLLLLNYTVHNPNKEQLQYDWGTLSFTVVDAENVNREYASMVGRIGTSERVSLELKPGQKLGVYTVVVVPAKGVVPKLIVQHSEGGPVLRYDLRKAVKAIPAPFADPADTNGATARSEVPGEIGKFYPGLGWDIKLVSTAYVNGALGEHELEEGQRFFVATVTFKNSYAVPTTYDTSTFSGALITADDEKQEYNSSLLKAARNEYASGELKPGQEYTGRIFYRIPKDVSVKTLQLGEADSRLYNFDVSGTK